MKKILVIGASGFVGRRLSEGLFAKEYEVRCLARTPSKIVDLATMGCEIFKGDVSDLDSVQLVLKSVDAVFIAMHTLSPQPGSTSGQGFMEIEMIALKNIVTACQSNGVRRLIYVTSLGVDPDSPSVWLQERWKIEQFLLNSALDVTIIRPGFIAGRGGTGFDMMLSKAKCTITFDMLGNGLQKMRDIAIEDLIYYLVGVLEDPRAYGQSYDVGSDDVQTSNQRIDATADVLGRKHPYKIYVPRAIMKSLASIEGLVGMPKGSVNGFLDALTIDCIGDPMPIRLVLPRTLLTYRQATELVIKNEKS